MLYFAGMSLSSINDDLRKRFDIADKVKGVLVTEVKENSAARLRGISAGDVIEKIDQLEVESPSTFIKIVDDAKSRK